MTILLVRLRGRPPHHHRVTSDAAAALTAVSDRLINGQEALELVQAEQDSEDDNRVTDQELLPAPVQIAGSSDSTAPGEPFEDLADYLVVLR